MMGGEEWIVNKLNCFFVFLLLSVSAAADPLPGGDDVVTLFPVSQLDPNLLLNLQPKVDCDSNPRIPGMINLDVSQLDQRMRRAAQNQDSEWEVNGQRYLQLELPHQDRDRRGTLVRTDGGTTLRFTGKKFKLTVPIP